MKELTGSINITYVIYCLCIPALVYAGAVDIRTLEIPVRVNIYIALLGLINLFFNRGNYLSCILGAVSVSGLFLIIYFATKGRGIGGGDIKLMAAAGLLLGIGKILIAALAGAVLCAAVQLFFIKNKEKGRVFAFGPYLCIGIFIAMLFGLFAP